MKLNGHLQSQRLVFSTKALRHASSQAVHRSTSSKSQTPGNGAYGIHCVHPHIPATLTRCPKPKSSFSVLISLSFLVPWNTHIILKNTSDCTSEQLSCKHMHLSKFHNRWTPRGGLIIWSFKLFLVKTILWRHKAQYHLNLLQQQETITIPLTSASPWAKAARCIECCN